MAPFELTLSMGVEGLDGDTLPSLGVLLPGMKDVSGLRFFLGSIAEALFGGSLIGVSGETGGANMLKLFLRRPVDIAREGGGERNQCS